MSNTENHNAKQISNIYILIIVVSLVAASHLVVTFTILNQNASLSQRVKELDKILLDRTQNNGQGHLGGDMVH
jgi:Zn finger protein HypA/HybF involved in hydrogenase expression